SDPTSGSDDSRRRTGARYLRAVSRPGPGPHRRRRRAGCPPRRARPHRLGRGPGRTPGPGPPRRPSRCPPGAAGGTAAGLPARHRGWRPASVRRRPRSWPCLPVVDIADPVLRPVSAFGLLDEVVDVGAVRGEGAVGAGGELVSLGREVDGDVL